MRTDKRGPLMGDPSAISSADVIVCLARVPYIVFARPDSQGPLAAI